MVLSTSTATTASPALPPRVVGADFADPELGWAVLFTPCGAQTCWAIYVSNDGGLQWQARTDQAAPLPSPSFSPTLRLASHEVAWLFESMEQSGDRSFFLATFDGGRTWADMPVDGEVLAIEPQGKSVWRLRQRCVPSGDACDDSIDASDDFGRTWQALGSPPPHDGLINGFIRPDAATAYVVSDHRHQPYDEQAAPGSILVRTRDGGRSWQTLLAPCASAGAELAASSPTDVWFICVDNPASGAMQGKHLFRSSDGGEHWSGDLGDMNAGSGGSTAVASPTRACRGGHRTGIDCTFDGGLTWKWATIEGQDNYFDGGVDVVKFFGLRGWATGFTTSDQPLNLVWRTTDGGKSWSAVRAGASGPE